MISRACYCTREDVAAVMQMAQSSRSYPSIDRAIEAATRTIDRRCHRTFHPTVATRSFLWPEPNSTARTWRFWLDANELISATTVTSGGTVIPASGYYLEPQSSGPPYSRLETNLGSVSAFSSGPATQQRSLSIAGLYGYDDVTQAVALLSGAISSTSATTLTVTDGSQVGIGDLLKIDAERMIVTGRSWVTSSQTLLTPIADNAGVTAVAISTGASFYVGETITLDTEQMLITDIIADTLVVQRAVNSTVLTAHTSSTIYVPRVLTVTRAANGTTAATHADLAVVSRQVVPAPVRSLAVAEAVLELQQQAAGWARTAGSGDNERLVSLGSSGLADLRDQIDVGYTRKVRKRAV